MVCRGSDTRRTTSVRKQHLMRRLRTRQATELLTHSSPITERVHRRVPKRVRTLRQRFFGSRPGYWNRREGRERVSS